MLQDVRFLTQKQTFVSNWFGSDIINAKLCLAALCFGTHNGLMPGRCVSAKHDTFDRFGDPTDDVSA
jgi:hypothetical protein